MNYRTAGKTGERVSILGFGTMRLPVRGGNDADVDVPEAVRMIRHAVDRGVNYVDSAFLYHGGNSEKIVGRALRDGYREKVLVATKLPVWSVGKVSDADRIFAEQLERLGTRRIDFYLMHSLSKTTWDKVRGLRLLEWAERKRSAGALRHLGFSFHDSFEVFREVADGHDWSFCQIQYNLVNEDVQAGTRGLEYAARKGLGVIVMEPLFGGTLAHPPEAVRPLWGGARPADVLLRWVWARPEVSVVLSGMSAFRQVEENLESAGRGGPWLTAEERGVLERIRRAYAGLAPIPCTKCGYCRPCPHGVDIPFNFELYNDAAVHGGNTVTLCRNLYQALPEERRASACRECRECEEKCPQRIPVAEELKRVRGRFG